MSSSNPSMPPLPPTPQPGMAPPTKPPVPMPAGMKAPPVPQPKGPPMPPGMDGPAQPAPDGAHVDQSELPHTGLMADDRFAGLTGLATSVFLHAIIIVVAFFAAYEPARNLVLDQFKVEEQNIIPTAELATETPGGLPNPGLNNDSTRAPAQDIDASVTQSDSWAQTRSENLNQTLASASTGTSSPIGFSTNTSGGLASQGGGALARFGAPGGGMGIGPKGAVFGNGGNAYRIAFVCDGTGTMVGIKLQLVVRELRNTINKLKPVQEFNVIFFKEGDQTAEIDKNSLLPATPANKRRAIDFFEGLGVGGSTNPLPAIEMAFKQKPQLMYILSDGEFDNLVSYDQVIQRIDELNADKSVKINTIMFGDRDDKAEAALKKIADSNGGRMVFVPLDALLKQ